MIHRQSSHCGSKRPLGVDRDPAYSPSLFSGICWIFQWKTKNLKHHRSLTSTPSRPAANLTVISGFSRSSLDCTLFLHEIVSGFTHSPCACHPNSCYISHLNIKLQGLVNMFHPQHGECSAEIHG